MVFGLPLRKAAWRGDLQRQRLTVGVTWHALRAATVCALIAAPTVSLNAAESSSTGPMALSFTTACEIGFEIDDTPVGGSSITQRFSTPTHDYHLNVHIHDKTPDIIPALLEVLKTDKGWFVEWNLFKPSNLLVTTLTSLAIAKHRMKFVFYFHGLPGTSFDNPAADGMILDQYSIFDSGPC